MNISVKKPLNMLVKSAQNRSTYSKICPENSHEIGCFLPMVFCGGEVSPPNFRKVPAKWVDFFTNLSEALKKVIA